jgi:glycosyltransferase involved in cell wall biosynthesis
MLPEKDKVRQEPVVSIGMPVFNDEKHLRQSLDSLLAQSFKDFELVISDNASTDKTPEICREYAARDQRIRYFRQPENLGQQRNFNFLLQQAQGEFFMWAASDDWWAKEFVEILLNALKLNDKCTSAFGPFLYVDENNQPISDPQIFDYSGRTILQRITKFCFYYNDAFFYGLHRRKQISKVRVPIWWGINAKTPINCAYPVLVFSLSSGGYVQAGTAPLWFNRIYVNASSRYTHISAGGKWGTHLLNYLAFVLRQINICSESLLSVYRGAHSIPTCLVVMPVLTIRCLYNCIPHKVINLFDSLRFTMRRFKKTTMGVRS